MAFSTSAGGGVKLSSNSIAGTCAYAVGIRQALLWLEAAGSDRGHVRIEIVDEDHHHAVARAIGVLHDVDRPVLGKRPHGSGRATAGAAGDWLRRANAVDAGAPRSSSGCLRTCDRLSLARAVSP